MYIDPRRDPQKRLERFIDEVVSRQVREQLRAYNKQLTELDKEEEKKGGLIGNHPASSMFLIFAGLTGVFVGIIKTGLFVSILEMIFGEWVSKVDPNEYATFFGFVVVLIGAISVTLDHHGYQGPKKIKQFGDANLGLLIVQLFVAALSVAFGICGLNTAG